MIAILKSIKTLPAQWIISSIVIGLIPIMVKLMIAAFHKHYDFKDALEITDLVVLGLILCLTTMNHINYIHKSSSKYKKWKERNMNILIGVLIAFACIYVFLIVAEIDGGINYNIRIINSVALLASSLFMTYMIGVSSSLKSFVK